jgi:hypothetical protein
MINCVGWTVDGSPVVDGLWQFRGTYGMPLAFMFEMLKARDIVPSWMHLVAEMPRTKLKELKSEIIDVYGMEYMNGINEKFRVREWL